jgi:5'(3')-deoxyribonucleotidase
LKLAIDVDSVLFQFLDSFNAYIDKIGNPYNAKLYTTPITWNMWEYMSITKEQWLAYMHEYTVNHGFLHGNLVENCIPEVVDRLAKRHEIIVLTARHHGLNGLKRQVVNDTVDWLAKENIKYHDICFVSKKDNVIADYLLDDAAHHLRDFSKVGIAVAYDTPYNKTWNGLRVYTWEEFERLIEL